MVLFYQECVGPEEKCKARITPSPTHTTTTVLISLLQPLLRFSASPCASLSLSKVVHRV